MNAGFSNLTTLKTHLLAPALVASTDFDSRVLQIGLGTAGLMAEFCNRKFDRVTGAQDIFPADYVNFQMNRWPLESLDTIELKLTEKSGWVAQTILDFVLTIDLQKATVILPENRDAGPYYAQLRFTYTGGFFWETLEPADMGYPTAVPNGATVLPDALRLAWLLQCKRIWESIDKIGDKISEVGPGEKGGRFELGIGGLELAPQVKQILGNYVRAALV